MNAPIAPRGYRTDTLPIGNSFATLPPAFFTRLMPTPLPAPYLVGASASAARLIGLEPAEFPTREFIETFTGNRTPESAVPVAAVYSGHQFGVWAGQLGDGRAILLGEVPDCSGSGNEWLELQLKGSGLTPYSRMGDGRAVLRSSIREFLCSEAMHGLGIPTSRALCVTGSDEYVMRETPETTAVVTRIAPTFVRFGSFEHWYYNGKLEELKTLADYVIDRFYPELRAAGNPYQSLLQEVTQRTAHLMADWQSVGFMHGVMNTDNMSILGLTLDYGPFGFMEAFDPQHICNHTDRQGRYSYRMQPQMAEWNCYALGQALLPLIGSVDATKAALEPFQAHYAARLDRLLHAKLGLVGSQISTQIGAQIGTQGRDQLLFDRMFDLMHANHVDFTLFFRLLCDLQVDDAGKDAPLRDLFIDRAGFDDWAAQYRGSLRQENSADRARRLAMQAVNPKYVLRNYLAQVAIEKAQNNDFSEVARLLAILEKPFDEQPEHAAYAELPPDWANQLEVSCSS